ncbi:hypothetical protein PAHAL_9G176700 [Panicum hallii]|uniref:Uncharacterized protein n=1 Tax=Panicum hallii TaxID=206008 RepID=A0A2T8I1P3_9POAL|nr:uncharacterized protein LOC112876978 [Panicum hallii]PVH31549.1 hypothetical protein PAHAL_9G176700 [Panicum hallii]
MHRVEENDLDQINLEDHGMENLEDDEACVFHIRDFEYEYAVDPDTGSKGSDSYDVVYKDLPKKYRTLKKAKNCEFCHAKRYPDEGPAFCCKKGKVNIYMPELPAELCRLFASRPIRMQSIFKSRFNILTRTSPSQALEFPLIIILCLLEVLVFIILKHKVTYIIDWISLCLVGMSLAICSYTFMTLMRPLHIG